MLAGILDAQSLTQKINGGSIIANGLELDLTALVSDNLTIVANMSLQDSTYDEFGAANRFQLGGTGPVGFVDLSGLDTPWAPSVAGNLSLSYDIHTDTAGLFVPHLQIAYSGNHWTTGLQQFDLAKQAAYVKLDARFYWESPNRQWTAQAYVENLSNEAILQHTIVGGSDIIQVSWGKPRMYGVKVGYRFD
jgi:iron complex outermembrane receptor protein